jgi:hypothetical protein
VSGILTASELEASLRVLRAVRAPVCATVLLTWPADETAAWVRLARAGYVETVPCLSARSLEACACFRWDRITATQAGLTYLEQIEATRRKEATVKK